MENQTTRLIYSAA